MPPLASSGPLYIGGVVSLALAFAWWLLRAEARDAAGEAEEVAAHEEHDQQLHDAGPERLNAP